MLTIERLIELKGVIKWHAVYGEAGLNPNTMRSAVHQQRELRPDEADALLAALSRHGIRLANGIADDSTTVALDDRSPSKLVTTNPPSLNG